MFTTLRTWASAHPKLLILTFLVIIPTTTLQASYMAKTLDYDTYISLLLLVTAIVSITTTTALHFKLPLTRFLSHANTTRTILYLNFLITIIAALTSAFYLQHLRTHEITLNRFRGTLDDNVRAVTKALEEVQALEDRLQAFERMCQEILDLSSNMEEIREGADLVDKNDIFVSEDLEDVQEQQQQPSSGLLRSIEKARKSALRIVNIARQKKGKAILL